MKGFVGVGCGRLKVGLVLAALASAGCGGGSPPVQSPLGFGPQLREHAVTKDPTVKMGFAVAETGSNLVRIYPPNNRKNNPPLCTVHGWQVIDIASDAKGDLYVPNGNGNIVEFAPGCGRRIATWHEREGQPDDVAVFGKTVYVGTLGNPPDKSGDVAVCTSTCNRVLRLPAVAELVGLAVDAKGNVWASTTAGLVVWRGGKMPGQVVRGYKNPYAAGLDFANDGTLLSLDEFDPAVYTYSCDAQTASCRQLGRWRLQPSGYYGKLDKANLQFQVANQQTDQVDVYAYPGFAYQYSYSNGLGHQYNLVGITAFPM
jgi:hypothetical protein